MCVSMGQASSVDGMDKRCFGLGSFFSLVVVVGGAGGGWRKPSMGRIKPSELQVDTDEVQVIA